MNSFKNFVPQIFEPRELKRQRQLDKIARERERDDAEKSILIRYCALRDARDAAKENLQRQCAIVDGWLQRLTPDQYVNDFLRGQSLLAIATDMAARSAFEAQAEDFKTALRNQLVTPAENALENFYRANKRLLDKVPLDKLKRAPEPAFTPAAPVNEWSDAVLPQPPAVRAMLGLRPGELVQRSTSAPFDRPTNGKMINDLDDD